MIRDLEYLGYRRIALKRHQEPSIRSFARSVKDGWSGEMTLEASPKGESRSNGEAERAVQTIQGLSRTLREHLETHSGVKLGTNSPIAWCWWNTAVSCTTSSIEAMME